MTLRLSHRHTIEIAPGQVRGDISPPKKWRIREIEKEIPKRRPTTHLTVANPVLSADLIKTFVMVIKSELNEFPPEIRREIRD